MAESQEVRERKRIKKKKKCLYELWFRRRPSGKPGGLNKKLYYLKWKVKQLSSSYKELERSVLNEIDEIKWNIKHLFHTLGLEYKKEKDQPKQWTSSSEELHPQEGTSSGSNLRVPEAKERGLPPDLSPKRPHPFISSNSSNSLLLVYPLEGSSWLRHLQNYL